MEALGGVRRGDASPDGGPSGQVEALHATLWVVVDVRSHIAKEAAGASRMCWFDTGREKVLLLLQTEVARGGHYGYAFLG